MDHRDRVELSHGNVSVGADISDFAYSSALFSSTQLFTPIDDTMKKSSGALVQGRWRAANCAVATSS